MEWRLENTISYLDDFVEIFLRKLLLNQYVRNIGFIPYKKTKRYYNFTQSVEQNKINSAVDVIELELNDLKIEADKKCIDINN